MHSHICSFGHVQAELVKQCTTEELRALGLGAPLRPIVPKQVDLAKLPMPQRLAAVQKVMASIQYNHQPGYMYNVSKDRPFRCGCVNGVI